MKDLAEKKQVKGFKNLKKYLWYFKKYKLLVCGFWFCLLLTGVISFFSPLVLGEVINHMTVTQDFNLAIKYAIIFACVEFAALTIGLIRVPFFKKLENYVKRDVKLQVIKDSFNINIAEYENLGNGAFVTRLTSDLNSLGNSFKQISETIVNFMSKVGFIVFVFVISPYIGFFLLFFVLLRYFRFF